MLSTFSTVAGDQAADLEEPAMHGQLEQAPRLVERLETTAQELVHLIGGLSLKSLRDQVAAAGEPDGTGGC
jgi:hypothetical protein